MGKVSRIFLIIVLMASAAAKLSSVSYAANLLFLMVPTQWLNTWPASNLSLLVIMTSIIELGLGFLLWMDKHVILYIVLGYLLLMLAVNGYQWAIGINDCACFGSWLQIPPGITFFKTLLLIGVTGYLMNGKKEITDSYQPVMQKQ